MFVGPLPLSSGEFVDWRKNKQDTVRSAATVMDTRTNFIAAASEAVTRILRASAYSCVWGIESQQSGKPRVGVKHLRWEGALNGFSWYLNVSPAQGFKAWPR